LGFDKDLTIYFVRSVMEEDCGGLRWKYIVEEGPTIGFGPCT